MYIIFFCSIGFYLIGIPGPAALVPGLQGELSIARWRQYVYVFLIIPPAVGLSYLKSKNSIELIMIIVILAYIIIIPQVGYLVAPDNTVITHEEDRGYFEKSEVTGMNAIEEFTPSKFDLLSTTYVRRHYAEAEYGKDRSRQKLRYDPSLDSIVMPEESVIIYRINYIQTTRDYTHMIEGIGNADIETVLNNNMEYNNKMYTTDSVVGVTSRSSSNMDENST